MYALLRKSPLVTIAHSVLDVYPLESCGWLYGRRYKDQFDIVHAFVNVNVKKRTSSKIYFHEEKDDEPLLKELATLAGASFLGDYHSHPSRQDIYLSALDIKSMDNHHGVYLVIGAMKKKRKQLAHWKVSEGKVYGTLDRVILKYVAYAWDKNEKSFAQIPLKCPSLINKK